MRCLFSFLLICISVQAQDSDSRYRKPLQDVLTAIEKRYGIVIQAAPEMLKDKWVDYADWRLRPDVEQTLSNVLAPLDMKADKAGDRKYKLRNISNITGGLLVDGYGRSWIVSLRSILA